MAKRFEIIENALVVTDTGTSVIEHEYPKRDVYFNNKKLNDEQEVEIYDTNAVSESSSWLFRIPLSECVDSGDTPFNATTWRAFARESLGKGSGSDQIGTIVQQNVVFREQFTGDGLATTFQLTGAIENATFGKGSWITAGIQIAYPSDVVDQQGKPIYDASLLFVLTRNRIAVASVSPTGLVTLTHPPRSGVDFDVYYFYQLQKGDELEDYVRTDYVSSMEADFSDLEAKIDLKIDLTEKAQPNGVATLDTTGKIPSSQLSGGGKSMILSFGSDTTYQVNSNAATYEKAATWIYAGSDTIGAINAMRINAWKTGGSTASFRIYDATNVNVIAEVVGVNSLDELNVENMGTISNVPTASAIFELQIKRDGGGVVGYCGSLEIEY